MIKKQLKYHNIRTGGYASKREAKRAGELKLLQHAGKISDLKEQVRFQFDTLKYASGRRVIYVADFTYIENKKYVVEDSKGMRTPFYKLKAALMLYFHDIEIFET